MRTSTRRGISYPLADRSDPADIPTHLANIVNALDLDTPFYSGTFASIPAVGSVVQGSWYWATDQSQLYQNNGTSWGAVLTGSALALTGDITARSGTGTAVKIGNAGPASQSGISFANAEDYLYRDAANSVTLQGATQITFKIGTTTQSGILNLMGQTTAGLRLQSYVASEANPRFTIQTDGLHAWGAGGASATDTNLYRAGVGALKTDSVFQVVGGINAGWTGTVWALTAATSGLVSTAAGSSIQCGGTYINLQSTVGAWAFQSVISGEANSRFVITNDGNHFWGPGGATALDTTLTRIAAGVLQIGTATQAGRLAAVASSTGGLVFSGSVTTDTVSRYAVLGDGQIQWGPGNAAADVVLYRSSAGNLRTNSSFWVDNSLVVNAAGGAGILYVGSALDTYVARSYVGVLGLNNKLVETFTNTNFTTLPNTWTPDVNAGVVQRLGFTAGGTGTLTIAAPKVGGVVQNLAGNQSTMLILKIVNAGGGTITLTWNAIYKNSQVVVMPASLNTGQSVTVMLFYNPSDAGWYPVAVA